MVLNNGPVYETQNPDQLLFTTKMLRFGFDPRDASAWVEEPITGTDDCNEFEEAPDADMANRP